MSAAFSFSEAHNIIFKVAQLIFAEGIKQCLSPLLPSSACMQQYWQTWSLHIFADRRILELF